MKPLTFTSIIQYNNHSLLSVAKLPGIISFHEQNRRRLPSHKIFLQPIKDGCSSEIGITRKFTWQQHQNLLCMEDRSFTSATLALREHN